MHPGLSIRQLEKSYTQGKPVLKGISLELGARESRRHHRALGYWQVHFDSVYQSAGAAQCRGNLVSGAGSGQALPKKISGKPDAKLAWSSRSTNLVERLTVMENVLSGRLGYMSAWFGVAQAL